MNKCYDCQHVEMCGWRESFEGRGCDFFDDGNKWIPCSERLPEEREWIGTKQFGTTISDEVYVTIEVPSGERITKHMCFQNGSIPAYKQRSIDAFYKGGKVVAWMPLPKPYREDGEA